MRSMTLALPLALALCAAPAMADDTASPPSITVAGQASVSVVPDTAVMTLGVVTDRLRAAEAAAENSRAVQAIVDALEAEGIDARDVQTTAASLTPNFAPNSDDSRIVGYRASNQLTIRVKPVAKAAALAGQLIDKGANTIDDITFLNSGAAKLQDQLKGDAMRDARRQAETYVGAIGLKLGRVLRIDPGSAATPAPAFHRKFASAAMAPAPPVPLEGGSLDFEAGVSVTWELVQ